MTSDNNDMWYQQLVDEIASLKIEAQTSSAWTLIVAYHTIGSMINECVEKFGRKGMYGQNVANKVAKSVGTNTQYVYDMMKFAEKFPDIQSFPGDKSMTWNKVRMRYLVSPESQNKKPKKKTCPNCGKEL